LKQSPAIVRILAALAVVVGIILIDGCKKETTAPESRTVPHQERWGIYTLDLSTENVDLIYSTLEEISGLDLDSSGTHLVFSLKGSADVLDTSAEIYIINTSGGNLQRLTTNNYLDTYPSFAPDGSRIVFLSMRNGTLDLYVMNSNGSDQQTLYDSGGQDADVDWGPDEDIVFTRDHQVWKIKTDGTNPRQVTDPPDAGEWGIANLPIGDYDPRLSPDGKRIVFERLEDPNTLHGSYNFFVVGSNGAGEARLTSNGYAQGLASWSHAADRIVYTISAVSDQGEYDAYVMDTDGRNSHSIMPDYFPNAFLVHQAIFSKDDTGIFFVGEWWE
jgi:Tol biopolymer transport system component